MNPGTPLITAFTVLLALGQAGCNQPKKEMNFSEDVAFLKKHVEVIVLGQGGGSPQVAVVPAYQGRVMTSTVGGGESQSHGWINYDLIAAGEFGPH
ncbi:MAG: DUF6786 family protein, partial [Verrucomicrobiota bacterium]|nr:DUF6786 family protein [Verrucomicrobiota bacterium]